MRSDKRNARKAEIEKVAYELFAKNGFEGTSMLAVAKGAKASNETMYRWYGDKKGLFESMVRGNAAEVRDVLEKAVVAQVGALAALQVVAPVLLGILLGEKAILLNRAAASDPTGALGALLSRGGREDVLPMIQSLLAQAKIEGEISVADGEDAGGLLMHLLVGDSQIRRVIGTMDVPKPDAIADQANRALAQFLAICAPDQKGS
ncbi:MAG: TetR/AcrR family transcriptional regulator [Sulfitobacter sp.]